MFGSTNPFGQSSTSSPFGSQSVFGQNNNANNNPFAPKPFGSTSPFGSNSTGVFGATQASSPLGSTTAFGASSTPAFGASSTPSFGASSTNTFGSSSSSFGGSSVFGQKPAFGGFGSTPTQSSPFGFQASQPAFGSSVFGSSPAFGAPSQPAFGASSTPAFGASSTPAFGATSSPAFGATNTPAFGSTANHGFGASSPSIFGASSTPAFGASSAPAFGASSTPAFGASSTPAFGASSTPSFSFGPSPAFGQSTSAFGGSPFGAAPSAFGSQSAPFGGPNPAGQAQTAGAAGLVHLTLHPTLSLFGSSAPFGGSTSTSIFGASSSSAFGSSPSLFRSTSAQSSPLGQTSAFGQTSSAFGQTNSAFGQTSSPFGQTSTPFGQTSLFNTPSTGFGGNLFSNAPSMTSNPMGFGQTTRLSGREASRDQIIWADSEIIDLRDEAIFDSGLSITDSISVEEDRCLQQAILASLLTNSSSCPSIIEDARNVVSPSNPRNPPAQSLSFVCEICFDPKPLTESFCIEGCTHVYCKECISSYVAAKLQDSVSKIGCPSPGCQGILDSHYCRAILPLEVFERWGNIMCESVIGESEKFYCPFKDCSALLLNEDVAVITQSECPYCNRLFCAQCKCPWHLGIECSEFQQLNEAEREEEDIMLMNLAKDKKWKRCPQCKMFVEKSAGCMHMKCRCQFAFCYNCGAASTSNAHICSKCGH